jgi:hypothetical protein
MKIVGWAAGPSFARQDEVGQPARSFSASYPPRPKNTQQIRFSRRLVEFRTGRSTL